jgi:multicomponent Na+:H+ antiporter subunit D
MRSALHIVLSLPLLLPLLGGPLLLLFPFSGQRLAAVGIAALTLLASGFLFASLRGGEILAVGIGSWPPPFGIVLAADLFSGTLLIVTSLMSLLAVVFSLHGVPIEQQRRWYFPLVSLLQGGVHGALLTGDVFNLYVWFEVLLMASFVLLTLGGGRAQLEGGLKYVTLNLIASALFLSAVGILYGYAGSLNFADLHLLAGQRGGELPWLTAVALLFFAFGVKAAVFPLFGWLPASYHTPPAVVAALFSALLTKVGVYAMVRAGTLLLPQPPEWLPGVLLAVAALTMITGVLGAVAQTEMKRLLSFHIVSQIGYLVMGFALGSVAGLAGTIFFFVHVIVAKAALFFVAGFVERRFGTTELERVGGYLARDPALAVVAFFAAMALAGLPPFSGFVAKLQLVQAGLEAKAYLTVLAAVVVSLLTLYSMTKIWAAVFWKAAPEGTIEQASDLGPASMRIPAYLLAAVCIGLGLFAAPVLELAHASATQLAAPLVYAQAILGR